MATLETLELDHDALLAAQDMVRKMAFIKWEQAGCPGGDGSEYWVAAEQEWIQKYYVPPRNEQILDGYQEEPESETGRNPAASQELPADPGPSARRPSSSRGEL